MPKATDTSATPFFFCAIEPFKVPTGHSLNQPPHRHPETMELLLVLEGTVQCQIDDQTHAAPSGTVLAIPSGTWHEQRHNASEQQSGYRLAFTRDPLPAPALPAEWPPVIPISDLGAIKTLFVRLHQEKAQPNTEQAVYHLIGLILALLSRSRETRSTNVARNWEATIQEIKLYMEENHCRSLTLEDIAERFGLNKYQLARTFKQKTAISPLQYLISCRMDAARRLLAATDHSMAAVAHAIGYKSATQFQAAFKKAVGLTPRQYRLAHQAVNTPAGQA